MFNFDTHSLFWNVSYKMVHTTETTALSRSWKNTPTAIEVSVSKLYVTFFLWCCNQNEWWGDCLLRFLDHTQTQIHLTGLFQTSDQLVTYSTQNKYKQWKSMHLMEYDPANPGTKPLQIYTAQPEVSKWPRRILSLHLYI